MIIPVLLGAGIIFIINIRLFTPLSIDISPRKGENVLFYPCGHIVASPPFNAICFFYHSTLFLLI